MGWSWPFSSGSPTQNETATTSPPSRGVPSTENSVALTDEQRIRIFGKPAPSPPQPQTQSQSQTREQLADSELDAFIKSFRSETDSKSTTAGTDNVTNAASLASPARDPRILPDGQLDISSEALLPSTMSCRQQFDQAFYCQSLGGKFNDIYRYGHLKSCSEQWGAFWFCMRTRTLPAREKEEAIKGFYRDRDERRKKENGSSEDVWQARSVAVTRAFHKDPDVDEEDVQLVGNIR